MDDRKQKRQRSIFTHAFATVHSESFSSGYICILQKGCINRNSHFQESPSKESKHYCPLPMLFSQTAFITPFFLSTNEYDVRGRLEVSGCTCTLQSGFRPQHQENKEKKIAQLLSTCFQTKIRKISQTCCKAQYYLSWKPGGIQNCLLASVVSPAFLQSFCICSGVLLLLLSQNRSVTQDRELDSFPTIPSMWE